MTNVTMTLLAFAGMISLVACSSSKEGGGTDATQPADSASADSAPVDGAPVDGASCTGGAPAASLVAAGSIGPLTTQDSPRPGFGWTFLGPNAGDAGTETDAGVPAPGATDAGGGPARCQAVPGTYQPGVSCRGDARLQSRTTGPVVAFDDEFELAWSGELPASAQPYVQQAAGDPVWVDYEMRWTSVCPFCGAYATRTLEIRDSEGGKVRFYSQSGVVLPNLTNAKVTDLFGATASAVPDCSFHAVGASCTTFDRTQYDHLLATTPAQTIPDADWTEVDSPDGTYEVFWASSTETNFRASPNCEDGPGTATDTGFVATLRAP
jgi:hypothetical protein